MTLTTASPAETEALGARLGAACRGGEVVLLSGELGAGKTCLTQGIARGLGLDPAGVTSPTFTLMQVHHGRLPLYHVDLYRVEDPTGIAHLELFDEPEGPGVTVVEWPERGGGLLPPAALRITVRGADGTRTFTLTAEAGGPDHLIAALRTFPAPC